MGSSSDYDAIVIGAGMAGLAAGIRLAMFDKRVLVLERHYQGGGLNSFYHRAKRPFDVGLHALTNYAAKGQRRAPLTKLLRQLRIGWDELELAQQSGSEVRFPGVTLPFSNEIDVLRQGIAEAFPQQADGFDRLIEFVKGYDDLSLDAEPRPSRPALEELISEPLLLEMLYCPLMYYGSAIENEMELGQFCTMFKSIFLEGFARPEGGVRRIVKLLVDRLRSAGGELRFKRGVKRILCERDASGTPRTTGVVLDKDDEVITAPVVISTAGLYETQALCPEWGELDETPLGPPEKGPRRWEQGRHGGRAGRQFGRLTFVETIACLDSEPQELGIPQTIVFFNDSERFDYREPEPGEPVDLRSGVICMPNNYAHKAPLAEGLVRVTSIARYDAWAALEREGGAYEAEKERWSERQLEVAERVLGSAGQAGPEIRGHTTYVDTFTPTTIYYYTRHYNGAVYGAPDKLKSGLTGVDGLYLAGTDQGFLGIVGAMLSGISIANARVLLPAGA